MVAQLYSLITISEVGYTAGNLAYTCTMAFFRNLDQTFVLFANVNYTVNVFMFDETNCTKP